MEQQSGFLLGVGQTLVCLGDSITEAGDGYVTIIANLIAAVYPERRIHVVNAGVGGHRVTDMRARLRRDVMSHDPDWVTVSVGINDVWHGFHQGSSDTYLPGGGGPNGIPLDLYEATLKELVAALMDGSRGRVVLVSPTIIGEDLEGPENRMLDHYAAAMRRVSTATGALMCPMHEQFKEALLRGKRADPTYSLTTDGVHMNSVGSHVMATVLLQCLGFFTSLCGT